MSCIIEFTGKPGAGKSHACMALLGGAQAAFPEKRVKGVFSKHHVASGHGMKAGVLLYTLAFDCSRFFRIFHQLTKALPGGSRRRLISSVVNAVYLDFRLRSAVRKYDLVVLDQGFIQLCWANLDKTNLENMKSVLTGLYGPYMEHRLVQVHVVASREMFESGLLLRKDLTDGSGYRFKHLDNGLMESLIDAADHYTNFSAIKIYNDVIGEVDIKEVVSSINDNICIK